MTVAFADIITTAGVGIGLAALGATVEQLSIQALLKNRRLVFGKSAEIKHKKENELRDLSEAIKNTGDQSELVDFESKLETLEDDILAIRPFKRLYMQFWKRRASDQAEQTDKTKKNAPLDHRLDEGECDAPGVSATGVYIAACIVHSLIAFLAALAVGLSWEWATSLQGCTLIIINFIVVVEAFVFAYVGYQSKNTQAEISEISKKFNRLEKQLEEAVTLLRIPAPKKRNNK